MGIKNKLGKLQHKLSSLKHPGSDGVHPVNILSALKTQAEAGKKIFKQKTMVPDHYTVCLAVEDYADLKPLMKVVISELRQELANFIKSKGYQLLSSHPDIVFQTGSDQDAGSVIVAASFGPADAVQSKEDSVAAAKAAKPTAVRLVIQAGDGDRDESDLAAGSHTIGRGKAADVMIPFADPLVSKQHCRIDIGPHGMVLLDLNSANGTYLNGRRLTDPEAIQGGDQIAIGNTQITVTACKSA